jgi:translocation and assembly module TamB
MSASVRPSEPPPAAAKPARGPRRRWLRAVLGGLLVAVLLPPLLLAGGLFWANSESGRATLARLIATQVPGLTLAGLEGPLPGRIAVARLALADTQGVWLEIEGATFDWDPWALARRTLRVEALTADRLRLHRLPTPGAESPPGPPGPLLPHLPELPLAVQLDRLAVAEIELGAALAGQPMALRAEGRGRLDPWGLTAALDLGAEDGETALALTASLRPGTGRLLAEVALRDRANGPVMRLLGLADRAGQLDLTVNGPTEGAAFRAQASAGPGLDLALEGTLRAPDLTRLGAELNGRIEAGALLPAPLAGPLEVVLEAGAMPDGAIDVRRLSLAGAIGQVQASGRIAEQRMALRVQASLPDSATLGALLPAETAGWAALQANATLEGALAAPRVQLTLAPEGFRSGIAPLAALLGPAPRLTLDATSPDRIERLHLAGAALTATLQGRAGAELDLGFDAEIATANGAVPGLAGAFRLSGTARGPAGDPAVTLQAASDRLEAGGEVLEAFTLQARIATPASAPSVTAQMAGRLQGLPLALDLRGSTAADGWLALQEATARLGPAALSANGRIEPRAGLFDGSVSLAVPDLAPLSPLLRRPVAGALKLEARLAPREGRQQGSGKLEAPRLMVGGIDARDLVLEASGGLAALELRVAGRAAEIEAELRARLSEAEAGARRLDIASFRAAGFGETLRLAAPARLTLRADGGVEVAPLTLTGSRGNALRAEGRWGPERADLRATIPGLALAPFAALLPEVQPGGTLSAELRVTGPVAAPDIQATLRGTQLRANAAWARGLPAGELRAEARRAGDGALTGRADLTIGAATRLAATARLPGGPAGPVEAAVDGNADLAALLGPLLAVGADRVTGRLALGLRLTGTLAAPVFGGEARLAGGTYRNALYGAALTDLAGTLRAEGERLRADIAGRTAGGGRVTLAGTIAPLAPGLPVDMLLSAIEARPVSSDLASGVLDAELRLAGALGTGAVLSGPIRLRRVDIRVPERLPASVRTLGPVVERGTPPGRAPRPTRPAQTPAPASAGPPITLAVQVEAPRNVFVRGRGLDAELGGTVAVTGPLAAPQVGGEFAMRRGDVQVLARRLTFDRGRLVFDGPLMPDLDFRATSQTGGTTVAVEITGPADAPVFAFTSTPELPPDEVLARLLFDRPTNELSPFELAQIAEAIAGATGLPSVGTAGILERIRRTLALDRLAVGGGGETASRSSSQEERRGATLEAGRYIAEGVYVGVRQGTETGSARVSVRVELTPRLRVEVETGDREAGERVGISWERQWGR